MIPCSVRLLPALIGSLLCQSALAQAGDPAASASIPLAYAGPDTRLSAGYDSRDKFRGEVMQVLAGGDRDAWIGELWVGRSAGGAQLDYHWLTEGDARVAKVFAAWDRNRWNDRKITIGGGAENEDWFWGAYVSAALGGRREVGRRVDLLTEIRQEVDPALGAYLQPVTTTTTTVGYEHPYDQGIGGRIGRFYDRALIRVAAGLDHEWGDSGSRQTTASLSAEKFFAGSPHSILVTAAVADRRGEFEFRGQERRLGIYWRYEFGGKGGSAWEPTRVARRVDDPPAAGLPEMAGPAKPATEKKVVQVAESIAAEAFFDLNRASLRPEAKGVLDGLIARLNGAVLEGQLRVTGYTCDLGPASYNKRLSELRAMAVRDYLVGSGVLPAERVEAIGLGEEAPRYPNSRGERSKNRRCDIEFAVVTPRAVEVPGAEAVSQPPATVAALSWHMEEVPVASPWYRRALRSPVAHKREVDFYRAQEQSVSVTTGPRTYLNRAPVAVDDWFWWFGSQMPGYVDVLANDSDPNNDALTVVSVTNGANGDVTIMDNGRLRYMWRLAREGLDFFTYTVSDGHNGIATAQVTIMVVDP